MCLSNILIFVFECYAAINHFPLFYRICNGSGGRSPWGQCWSSISCSLWPPRAKRGVAAFRLPGYGFFVETLIYTVWLLDNVLLLSLTSCYLRRTFRELAHQWKYWTQTVCVISGSLWKVNRNGHLSLQGKNSRSWDNNILYQQQKM